MKSIHLFFISIISVFFVSVSTCYPASNKVVVRPPKTITVPSDFSTINGALENAVQGDTIQVAAGTYNETLSISKNGITITGAGKTNTFISGNSSSSVIVVNGVRPFTIQNITIQGGYIGVYCISGRIAINECRIQNNVGYAGIAATYGSYVYLGQTDINENKYGLMAAYSCSTCIENCNIFSNSQEGVAIWHTSAARITSCDVYNNGANGIQVGGGSSTRLSLSKVHGNTYSGIGVSGLSSVALRGGNDIYSNADNSGWRAGIGAYHSSSVVATLEDSSEKDDIYLNNGPGVFISNNSSLFLSSGKVRQNVGNGINLNMDASAQLEDVSVNNNSGYGIACNGQSFCSKSGLTIITGNTLGDTDDCW